MGDASDDPQYLTAATATLSLKDTTYFLTSAVFKVEDTLFNVPRYHFDRNEVFTSTFKLPPPPGQEVEGSSETKPIQLAGISQKDFKAFLGVLYPLTIPPQYTDITTADWTSALELADMWSFVAVRDLAIRELSASNRLDAVSKINFGTKYGVEQWVKAGCSELLVRDCGPRADEARLLGEEVTTQIWDAREMMYGRKAHEDVAPLPVWPL